MGVRMWRSFFMAIAISLAIAGVECLVLNKAVLAREVVDTNSSGSYWDDPLADGLGLAPRKKTIEPPEWAPWSLLSAGAIVMLYALSMKRGGGDGD